jgi:hypothetical protein
VPQRARPLRVGTGSGLPLFPTLYTGELRHRLGFSMPQPAPFKGVSIVEVGDRIEVESEKVGEPSRTGVVTTIGRMITVRWDNGTESSFIPSAGSLRVLQPANQRRQEA